MSETKPKTPARRGRVKSPNEDGAAANGEQADGGPAIVFFPVETLREAAVHLRRPFTPAAVKFKVQAELGPKGSPSGGLIVAYIDVRLVVERLNLLVPQLWHDEFEPLAGNLILCHLTVDGVTRHDVGDGAGKSGYSDALKRAAVKFGVGVSLYAIPQVRLQVGDGPTKLRTYGKEGSKRTSLSDANLERLRSGYATWLAEHGEPAFGRALDHGDVEGAQGDPVEAYDPATGEVGAPVDTVPPASGEEAERLSAETAAAMIELGYTPAKRRTLDEAHRTLDEKRTLLENVSAELAAKRAHDGAES